MLDAVAAGAKIEIPHQLVHARAHEMVEETMSSLARQGISKEMYLQISGQSEEEMAHGAEEEAEKTLRREAVIAAVVEAEKIEPGEDDVLEALQPTAEREKTTPEKLFKRLEENGRLGRLRDELANRKAVEWLVEQAKPGQRAEKKAAADEVGQGWEGAGQAGRRHQLQEEAEPLRSRRSRPIKRPQGRNRPDC